MSHRRGSNPVGVAHASPLKSVENQIDLGCTKSPCLNLSPCKAGNVAMEIKAEPFSDHYTIEDTIGRYEFLHKD